MPRAISTSAPVGSCIDLPTSVAPDGYLYCNGAAVSRTTYAALFAVIGTAHGSGDGSTTFNLPDRRGYFTRGTDGGAGRDPDTSTRTAMNTGGNTGDNVGSVQASQYGSHSHPLSGTTGGPSSVQHYHIQGSPQDSVNLFGMNTSNLGTSHEAGAGTDTSNNPLTSGVQDQGLGSHTHPYSGTTTDSGGNETRGINAYTNYFIRY